MEVLKIWERMDDGRADFEEGLKQATKVVTRKGPEQDREPEREATS